MLVSDDDASEEVAGLVAAIGDPRVRYQANSPRLGQGLNPLLPMSRVDTPFVACLQDDDEWEPSLLATLVPPLVDDPDLVVAFSDHHLMDATGRLQPRATLSQASTGDAPGFSAGSTSPASTWGS